MLEQSVAYRLDSAMTLKVEGLQKAITFDSCELYRAGDGGPFLSHTFEPIVLSEGCTVEVSWEVRSPEAPAREV